LNCEDYPQKFIERGYENSKEMGMNDYFFHQLMDQRLREYLNPTEVEGLTQSEITKLIRQSKMGRRKRFWRR